MPDTFRTVAFSAGCCAATENATMLAKAMVAVIVRMAFLRTPG